MAVRDDNNIIYSAQEWGTGTEGINESDVDTVLKTGGVYDTSKLCASTEINQWARWKPIIWPTVGRLTLSNVKAAQFGLDADSAANEKALAVIPNGGGTIGGTYTWDEVIAANKAWGYNRPTGGSSSPYRLHDFLQPSDATDKTWGYVHNTKPPVQGVKDFDITLDILKTIFTGETKTEEGTGSTSVCNNVVTTESQYGLTYQNMIFKFGDDDGSVIGDPDVHAIRLNELFDKLETGYFRMGLLLYVSGGIDDTAQLIVSRMTMYEAYCQGLSGTNLGKAILPDWATNPYLAYILYNNVLASGEKSKKFTVLPVIVKNMAFTNVTYDEKVLMRIMKYNSYAGIYSMPGDMDTVTLTVVNTEESSEAEILADELFELTSEGKGYVQLGGNTGSAYRKALIDRNILTKVDITKTYTLSFKIVATYLTCTDGSTINTINYTDEQTITVAKGTAAGTTVYQLGARPEFNIVSSTLEAT